MPLINAYDSRSRLATDPIRNFKFLVEFHDKARDTSSAPLGQLGFMTVSGLAASVESIPYREGGDNTTPRKMPGQGAFPDVTMARGVNIGSSRNWDRMKRVFHAVQGRGLATPTTDFRFTLDIHVLDHPVNYQGNKHVPKLTFRLYNAWVNSVAYSDLDAGGNAVLVEQISLTHEGFDVKHASGVGLSTPPTPPN